MVGFPVGGGVKVEQVSVDLNRTFPTSAERLALILYRDEPGHRLTVLGNDDAGAMVCYVIQDLEAFGFELGGGDFGWTGHGLVLA